MLNEAIPCIRSLLCALVTLLAIGVTPGYADDGTTVMSDLQFKIIAIRGSAEVEIRQGERHEVQLRGIALDPEDPYVYVDNGVLHIGNRQRISGRKDIKVKIVLPDMQRLAIAGNGTTYLRPFNGNVATIEMAGSGTLRAHALKYKELEIRQSGASDIEIVQLDSAILSVNSAGAGDLRLGGLTTGEMRANLGGSGGISLGELGGTIGTVRLNLAGSGGVDLLAAATDEANVNLVGSSSARLQVETLLDVRILGSGSVRYRGEPRISSSVLGSGRVTPLGA